MDVVLLLMIAAIPAIIVIAGLYAALAEMRHNRVRRSRWEPRGQWRDEGPLLEPVGHPE
jgi:hypothetical protein